MQKMAKRASAFCWRYLVATTPILQEVVKLSPNVVGIVLLAYGIAVAIGNEVGGRWANHNPVRALFSMFMIQAAVLIVMTFIIPFKVAGLIAVFLMGLFAFMNVHTPWVGGLMVIVAVVLTGISAKLERK